MSDTDGLAAEPVDVNEVKSKLAGFNWTMATVVLIAVALEWVVIVERPAKGQAAWGLLVVATAGAAAGAFLALWLSALQSENARFREVLTAATSAAGGTALFDLGNPKGLLHRAVESTAVGCGFDPGDGLVVCVFVAFAAFACIWLYVNKKAWINSLIARGTADADKYDARDTSAPPPSSGRPSKGGAPPAKGDGDDADDSDDDEEPGPEGDAAPTAASMEGGPAAAFARTEDAPETEDVDESAAPAAKDVGRDDDDPLRPAYAGRESQDGLRIAARVTQTDDPDWFDVYVVVSAADRSESFAGTVTFRLHPTFNPSVIVRRAKDGRATLNISAWGAFTLGADVRRPDGSETRLGIDLAALSDAPTRFRQR